MAESDVTTEQCLTSVMKDANKKNCNVLSLFHHYIKINKTVLVNNSTVYKPKIAVFRDREGKMQRLPTKSVLSGLKSDFK